MRKLLAPLVLLILLCATSVHATPDSLTRTTQAWKGDLPELLKEKRPLRVLVSYNRTNFFLVHGAMRGMEHDFMQEYKKYLSKRHKTDHVRIAFVAVPFDELIPALVEGRGDVIAAGLTVTTGRKGRVNFSAPYRANVSEVVVGSKNARPVTKKSDLSGRKVHVMTGSSYVGHLKELSHILEQAGNKPITIVEADPHLVTEDLIEMAARGLIEYTVADSHLVEIWTEALPDVQAFTDAPIHEGGTLAWAVRPGSKELAKSLSAFAKTVQSGTLMGNMVYKRYFENTDWVKARHDFADREKMDALITVFQKYGSTYDLDWIKLGALAFQESHLNMDVKSSQGAVGIMQVKPSTALDANVNVKDYMTLDGNIHAGTKYLRFLMDRYFKDVNIDARVDFALASYNAGPGRVMTFRKVAREMGLDPNKWFGNVEWAAYKVVGKETPTYVANIQMYYAAYKSIFNTVSVRAYD